MADAGANRARAELVDVWEAQCACVPEDGEVKVELDGIVVIQQSLLTREAKN
jgi:hypothetical protein